MFSSIKQSTSVNERQNWTELTVTDGAAVEWGNTIG